LTNLKNQDAKIKNLQTQLALANHKLHIQAIEVDQIFQTAGDGMRLIDTNFKVIRINDAFKDLAGIKQKDDCLGNKCYEIFCGKMCNTPKCPLVQITYGKNEIKYNVEKKRQIGEDILCCLTALPVRDQSGKLISIVEHFIDLSKQQHIEKTLHKTKTILKEKSKNIEELNTSLKTLIRLTSGYEKEIKENFIANIIQIILPFIEELKMSDLTTKQQTLINNIELNLNNIANPLVKLAITKYKFTPMEIQIGNFIKMGKTNDEIANMLNLSKNTILTHRSNLRSKLGLKNKKINLRSRLLLLSNDND